MALIHLNGKLSDQDETYIPANDRSFLYGDGVFTTLRTIAGHPFLVDRHASRLLASARALGFQTDLDEPSLVRIIKELCAANLDDLGQNMYIRATLSRGQGYGPDVTRAFRAALLVYARALPAPDPSLATSGLSAILATERRSASGSLARYKSTSYLECLLARREAITQGAHEAVIVDTDERVCEAACSNLFIVTNQRLLTPPLSMNLLPGIMRECILGLARGEEMAVSECAFNPKELAAADEAFLTNSVQGVAPLTSFQQQPIGAGIPGPLTTRLANALNKRMAEA